jgi:hypothetical protein
MKSNEQSQRAFALAGLEQVSASARSLARRWPLFFLLAITLAGCSATSDGPKYDPFRCDRNGDESQRRSC